MMSLKSTKILEPKLSGLNLVLCRKKSLLEHRGTDSGPQCRRSEAYDVPVVETLPGQRYAAVDLEWKGFGYYITRVTQLQDKQVSQPDQATGSTYL